MSVDSTPSETLRCPVPDPLTGGVPALDDLLREVHGLRRTLETDLCLVASATEVGALEIAHHLLSGGRVELPRFEARALDHLRRAPA